MITSAPNLYVEYTQTWGPGRETVLVGFLDGAFSDQELATRTGLKHKTVSARRVELWRLGLVEPVAMRVQKRQRARVWALTPCGRDCALEIARTRESLL